MTDYYDLLGVPRNATSDEIRSSFRKLSLEVHPDRNGGDEASSDAFKELSEAHEILTDPDARLAYDTVLVGHRRAGRGGGLKVRDVLDGLGSMAGLFMEAMARANPGEVASGKCAVCNGTGDIAIDIGALHLSKRCEACSGEGTVTITDAAPVGEEQE